MKSESQIKIGILADLENLKPIISRCLPAHGAAPIYLTHNTDIFLDLQKPSGMDALILDLDSPNINFSALLSKLHEEYPLLKVVVCSSDCEPRNVRMAMHFGAFDFIPKPLDYNDCNQTIQRTLSAVKKLHRTVNDYDEVTAIEHELDVARDIQNSIIPKQNSVWSNPAYEIMGRNQAAQKVGGDFFDYFTLNENRLGFVIGDVASKGIPAAIFMAVSRTLFKAIAHKGIDPATCLTELNNILVLESDPSMFIAILYGIIDLSTGEIVYSNGGHTHPIIVRSDGSMQILDHAGDIVLGVIEDVKYQLYHEKMNSGDIFFTATDGFSELSDLHGKPVGDHFLKRNLIKHRHQTPEQILDTIYEFVEQIQPDSRSLSDDITCLLFKFKNYI